MVQIVKCRHPMWIVPPLMCVMGIVVACLPPADPIEDVEVEVGSARGTPWLPILLTSATVVVMIGFALRTVLVS